MNKQKMHKKRIILSGGGTGGHIFPAVSIARKLQVLLPEAEFLFVGANGKMEMEKVPQAGFPIKGLPVSAFHRRLTLKNLTFIFKLLASLIKARKILREFKPDLVIGTGGFASGPIVKEASRVGIPCLLQEQNAFPGVTNRMLGKKVNTICVAHDGLSKYFPADKIVITGNPVREDIGNKKVSREEALQFFGLQEGRPIVFVFGGSLGARTLNMALASHMREMIDKKIQLIWQTGTDFYPGAVEGIEKVGFSDCKVYDFISRMDLAYQIADVIVSRAGAISISELCLVGKPVILVPYPHAAGDHQLKNAKALFEKKAALLVEDKDADKKLIMKLLALLGDKEKMKEMGMSISAMGKADATMSIAEEAIKLLKTARVEPDINIEN